MKPQISDDVSLSIGFGSHLNLAAGYTHIGDWVMQVPHVLDNGDQYLEWGNFGKSNTAYLAFSVSALPSFILFENVRDTLSFTLYSGLSSRSRPFFSQLQF
ncbi:MAG: hypothetical protein ACI4PX_02900 [Ruminococcus sp.]